MTVIPKRGCWVICCLQSHSTGHISMWLRKMIYSLIELHLVAYGRDMILYPSLTFNRYTCRYREVLEREYVKIHSLLSQTFHKDSWNHLRGAKQLVTISNISQNCIFRLFIICLISPNKVIQYHQQMIQIAFCDLSKKSEKKVINVFLFFWFRQSLLHEKFFR